MLDSTAPCPCRVPTALRQVADRRPGLRRRVLGCGLGIFLALGWVASPAAAARLEGVSLEWRPTEDLEDLEPLDLEGLGGERLRIEPFLDLRADPQRVGENRARAHRMVLRAVTTEDPVGEWVAQHFAQVLAETGVEIVEHDAALVLSGEIRRFFVVENDEYVGRSEIYLRLRDGEGAPLVDGIVRAQVERYGRPYRLRNYHQTLSDLVVRTAHWMLREGAFRRELDAVDD